MSKVCRADYTALEEVLKHKCEFCGDGFDTKQGRNQHNVITTCGLASREVFEEELAVHAVIDARGAPEHRFYLDSIKCNGRGMQQMTQLVNPGDIC